MALLKLYEQGGFEIDPEFPDLPDPVAVELEFMYLLTHHQNQAAAGSAAHAQSQVVPQALEQHESGAGVERAAPTSAAAAIKAALTTRSCGTASND
jgi:Nitrate reductase delta subunit